MQKYFNKFVLGLFFYLCLPAGFANADGNINYNLYYFMGNIRCNSCYRIESYTKEVYDGLENKDIISFKILNIDEKENQHYLKDYNLYTKSVVIARLQDGKEVEYKNLDRIWSYLGNREQFKEYLRTEIDDFTNGAGR